MNVLPGAGDDAEASFQSGNLLQRQLRFADALACYRQAIALRPDHAGAHNNAGVALMELGRLDDAIASFHEAIGCRPSYAEAHNNMGVALKRQGKFEEALVCYGKALALEPDYAKALFNVGTLFYERKDFSEAMRWYRASLAVDPKQVEANQNMALILEKLGNDAAAKVHRDLAYGRQSMFVDGAPHPRRTVLVLWGAGLGNVPIEFLLPKETITRIVWIVEYARADDVQALPGYEVAFNAIGDPDVVAPTAEAIDRILDVGGRRLLNHPAAVARTRRDLLPALLGGNDVVVPATHRIARDSIEEALSSLAASDFPVLLRPTSSHGGDHMVKLDSPADIDGFVPWNADNYYLTAYRDYRSPDGRYRKYRIIFIDRKPYPYHLAVAEHWMVHYETAGMQHEAWKREEERRFLADPAQAIGSQAMAALESIGKALDLDYCGIDFSLLPDGRVLVFEANATMLVHPEDDGGCLAYKNRFVRNILAAFEALLFSGACRSARPG